MHDEWLAIIAAAIGKISHIDEPLVLYRQHGANQIGAPRRGVVDQFRWLMASRGGVRQTLPPRMRRLVERLERLGSVVSAEKLAAAKLALKHATVRAGLPSARWRRLGPIWHEWRSGRYKTCSRGLRSLVADIFEPINQAEDSRRYSP
jgi:hypothetical protein